MPLVVHPANHWLWYIAQISLGGSFIAPSLLVLRFLLATGFLFLLIWSVAELSVSVDSAVFAGTYCLINLAQAARILYARRYIKFDADREAVYDHYFGLTRKAGSRKWHCSRVTWQELNRHSRVATLRKGEAIARAGDRCETLTFLLSGRISFQHSDVRGAADPVPMHSSEGLGVIDAVEYIHRNTARGAVWGIDAVAATEDVRVLILSYAQIDAVSENDMAIEPVINGICGVQVTSMLFATEDGKLHQIISNTLVATKLGPDGLVPVQQVVINMSEKENVATATEMTRFHMSE